MALPAPGTKRLEELHAEFPALPQKIVTKMDVLRAGVRYTPEVEEAGARSLPFFLLWNPVHAENPTADEERFLMIPWKFDLGGGVPVKLVLAGDSPYTVRGDGGHGHVLCRDGEEIEEIFFEERPKWYMTTVADGKLLPTVIQLFSRTCLFGCILRYCEYSRAGEQCRYCSLDSTVEDFHKRGFEYSIAASADHWAEGFTRALGSGQVRHVSLTGGSLLDRHKEALHYDRTLTALREVRERLGSSALFEICTSAMTAADQQLLKEAGLNVLAHHMDTWEERLWPEIVPGKARHVGRDECMSSLERAVELFGWGNVQSNFVIGVETACANGIREVEAGVESWRNCFSTLAGKGIMPRTTVWQATEGSAYYGRERPPTEYFLRVAHERHLLLKEYGMYGRGLPYPCYRCNCWSCDIDFMRLLDDCRCGQCV